MSEQTIIEAVVALEPRALARMWVDLNRWEWPRDLPPGLKPDWWDGIPLLGPRESHARKHGLNEVLMSYAAARVPDEMIGEEWAAAATSPKAKSKKRSVR